MISKNQFFSSYFFLVCIIGLLFGSTLLMGQDESKEQYSDSTALNKSIKIFDKWELLIKDRAYQDAQELVWEARTQFIKPDYQFFVLQAMEQYLENGIISKKFEVHEKLIDWFSIESEYGENLAHALLQEYIEAYYLIEAETLYNKFSSSPRADFVGSRLYRRFNEIEKSLALGQRAIDNFVGKKNMDYYNSVGNLADAYFKIDFNKADSLMNVCFDYFIQKDEAMFDFYYTRPMHGKIDFQLLKSECDQLDTLLHFVRETINNNSFYKDLDLAVNDFYYARYFECIGEISKAKEKLDQLDFNEVPLMYQINILSEKLLFALRHNYNTETIAAEVLGQFKNNYIKFAPYLSDRELINYNFSHETIKDKLAKTILTNNQEAEIQKQYLEYEFIQKSSFYHPSVEDSISENKLESVTDLTQNEIEEEIKKLNDKVSKDKFSTLSNITFDAIQKSLHERDIFINLSYLSDQKEYIATFFNQSGIQKIESFVSDAAFKELVISFYNKNNQYTKFIFFPDGYLNNYNFLDQFNDLAQVVIEVVYGFQFEKIQPELDKVILMGKSKFAADINTNVRADISSDLPAVRLEIQSLQKIIADQGITTNTYLDDSKAYEIFTDLSENPADIIHVATHGIYNASEIDHSLSYFNPKNYYRLLDSGGLVIGESDHMGTKQILGIPEVNQLNMEGSTLVSLLSCHSGFSNANDFYGSLGMARAFIKSGTKNVITASGLLSDELSLKFSEYFYAEFLQAPDEFSSAINKAHRKTLETYPHVSALNIMALQPFIIKGDFGAFQNKLMYLIGGFILIFMALFFLRNYLSKTKHQ